MATIVLDENVATRVVALLHRGRPLHIARYEALNAVVALAAVVAAIVVWALQSCPVWAIAQLRAEAREVSKPLARKDAATAMRCIAGALWIQSAIHHRYPRSVLW